MKRRNHSTGCADLHRTLAGSRREFLRVGSLAGLGVTLGDVLRVEGAQKHYESREGKAKSVIQIVLQGGVAAQESWNPKPESPLEYRGPFGVAKTSIPGVVFSDVLKNTAKIADKLTVIRSLNGRDADHGRAMYAMMTGYRQNPALVHPSIGAVVNHELGGRAGLPGFIGVPSATSFAGTGYLSPRYGAFSVGGDPASGDNFQVRDLRLPSGIDEAAFAKRRKLREMVDDQFRKLETDRAPLDAMDSFYQQAYSMISSQEVRDAFDISKESTKIKETYGLNGFRGSTGAAKQYGSQAGMRMLLARRLVEAGARFVSLTYGGWDTHTRLRETYQEQMPAFDNALATLISDLDERGLLDSTLVWVVSEFGRSPKINASAGRDHYPRVFSTALAGGGLKRGLVYGASDATSSEPSDKPMPLEDLHKTLYSLIGINADKELMAPGGRPVEIIDGGNVITDLIA